MGFGLFRRSLSPEERIESLEMESEALSHEKDVVEKRAVIAQLKQQYGPRWRQVLGVKGFDLATLRSFLVSANGGLRREQDRVGNVSQGDRPGAGVGGSGDLYVGDRAQGGVGRQVGAPAQRLHLFQPRSYRPRRARSPARTEGRL